MTNIFSNLSYSTTVFFAFTHLYFPLMEEFDIFARQIRYFLLKELGQRNTTKFFAPKSS